jgi:membrane-bound serine protease (ClpP class)
MRIAVTEPQHREGRTTDMQRRSLIRIALGTALAAGGLGTAAAGAQEAGPVVVAVAIDGVVDPFVADHVRRAIQEAPEDGAAAVLIEIDTPGGLDSSMREITQAILNAETPVICWVGPPGARAASAGAFVLASCPIAAMAPGTNVGAATPVGISGATLSSKVENDAAAYIRSLAQRNGRPTDLAESFVRDAKSITAETALQAGFVDLIASSRPELLAAVDGMQARLGSGDAVVVTTAGAVVDERGLGSFVGFLHGLVDPNLAFILFWLGLVLIVLELLVPGHIFSGTIGTAMLIVAVVSFGLLPVRLLGVILLIASVVFFLLELKVPGLGIWSVLGVASLALGGWFLFDRAGGAGVSPAAIVPIAAVVTVFFGFVVTKVLAMRSLPPAQGIETLIGREGVVLGAVLAPEGVVRVAAEEWKAVSTGGPIPGGTRIRVTAIDGLVLTVEPVTDEHSPTGGVAPARGGNP